MTDFNDVRFPADYAALLEMTQSVIRTNRRLVAIIGEQHYAIDALIDAVDNDDGHRLAQLVLEYRNAQAIVQSLISALQSAPMPNYPTIQ